MVRSSVNSLLLRAVQTVGSARKADIPISAPDPRKGSCGGRWNLIRTVTPFLAPVGPSKPHVLPPPGEDPSADQARAVVVPWYAINSVRFLVLCLTRQDSR
jgi:hypothetical protein